MRLVNYLSKMKRDGTTNHAKDNCLSIRDQDLFMKKLYAVYSLRGANKFHTNDELIRLTLNHFNLNVKHFADQESTNSKEILGKILEPFGFTKEEINSPKFLFKFEIAKLFPIVYLAFSTGMRLSELLALEWSDIDFEEKIIHVCKSSKYSNKANHSQTSGHFLSGTKNKENRTLDITKDDVEFLKKHKVYQTEHRFNYEKRINNNYYDNNLVFAKKNGTYLRNDTVSDVFSTFAKRLGSNVTFHSTRHFHITLLLTIGVPVVKVAERVGHKKASVTSDTYVHVKKGYQTNLGESYHNALKKTNGIAEEQLSKAQEIASKLMLENDDFN